MLVPEFHFFLLFLTLSLLFLKTWFETQVLYKLSESWYPYNETKKNDYRKTWKKLIGANAIANRYRMLFRVSR